MVKNKLYIRYEEEYLEQLLQTMLTKKVDYFDLFEGHVLYTIH